ncbi:hypothetical protein N7540_006763 [Penicillium herquei]|nr:hypothetical protein N7540_006763 [Penicillium herquei]
MPSNRPNGCEDRDPCEGRKEQQRPSFEPELSVKDDREKAHSARKNDIANLLQAMLGDGTDTFVLLCWGKEYECSIIPVKISDADNETVIWRKVRQEWCSRRVAPEELRNL